jgi:hypothetical protein
MTRRLRGTLGIAALGAGAVLSLAIRARAASLDTEGDISLGIRAYTAARIGTENTDITICNFNGPRNPEVCGGSNGGLPSLGGDHPQTFRTMTFPVSAAGHLRQSRFFVEAELKHNLDRLLKEGFGPLALVNNLPFSLRNVGYDLTYRGEYDGVYDYGPAEYSTAYQYSNQILLPPFNGQKVQVFPARNALRSVASERQRLFQAFLEADAGPFFVRFGRQILAWGETDVFRLLDNINPLDNSFGGFLVPLDERRVPIDMLRASYHIPNVFKIPKVSEMFIEGYVSTDSATAIKPGIPNGSPWQLPNLLPSSTTNNEKDNPPSNFSHARGGFQLKVNAELPVVEDTTFAFAHYYTYVDTPQVQTIVNRLFPVGISDCFGQGISCLAIAKQSVPTVQITGASSTFSIPQEAVQHIGLSGEPIVRTELAYFHGEPRFNQAQLDPFIYFTNGACRNYGADTCTGGRGKGDSWNFVVGLDLNQFIRPINPNQSIFITTQFFYKHLNGGLKPTVVTPIAPYIPGQPHTINGEVLPVPAYYISPDNRGVRTTTGSISTASEPVFIHNPVDQYLQTLLIGTSYYSGQVVPSMSFFYDWSGSFVFIPQVTFSRDPFRFTMGYSYLTANTLKGASGISLLRDRDNLLFQFEYVL